MFSETVKDINIITPHDLFLMNFVAINDTLLGSVTEFENTTNPSPFATGRISKDSCLQLLLGSTDYISDVSFEQLLRPESSHAVTNFTMPRDHYNPLDVHNLVTTNLFPKALTTPYWNVADLHTKALITTKRFLFLVQETREGALMELFDVLEAVEKKHKADNTIPTTMYIDGGSVPDVKLYIPEAFMASPNFIIEDIWWIHVLHFQF
jgi:hypothetical protein